MAVGDCSRLPEQPIVQLSRSNVARRSAASWTGIRAETIDLVRSEPFEYCTNSPYPMLVLIERGGRVDGETAIEGGTKSALRDIGKRLCFVPAGRRFHGWTVPRVLARSTYFQIEHAGPLFNCDLRLSEIEFTPRLFFYNRDLWETAFKLKGQIENPLSRAYAESLAVVLVHELIQMNDPAAVPPVHRGGLAGWQQKRLEEYIFDHLSEEISLTDLANVAQLTPFHFIRAFKQTFGEPPYRYLIHRRIERAKKLLENSTRSVGEIAQAVGFGEPASFTAAFRRTAGTTPTAYRRAVL